MKNSKILSFIVITIISILFITGVRLYTSRSSVAELPIIRTSMLLVSDATSPSNSTSLRGLAQQSDITIGAAVLMEPFYTDETYRKTIAREFNSITPENAMKFGQLHAERDRYNFVDANALVKFAQQHQMQIHGHTLVWHRNLPTWLTEQSWTREELMSILQQHIYTVVSHFRGQVASWDVVNEAVSQDGQSSRDTIWLRGIGPEYIELAFRWAHEADPAARLFYNDYRGEELNQKSNTIYERVKDLKQRGVPIHGVGLQFHTAIFNPLDFESVAKNMERLGQLDLEVRITEIDVRTQGYPGTESDRQTAQAQLYQNAMILCLKAPNCSAFTTWGVADHLSSIRLAEGYQDSPLLFDESYRPKPAYSSIAEALSHHSGGR